MEASGHDEKSERSGKTDDKSETTTKMLAKTWVSSPIFQQFAIEVSKGPSINDAIPLGGRGQLFCHDIIIIKQERVKVNNLCVTSFMDDTFRAIFS